MDVRAENRGRPHQKCVSCGPGGGEKLFDPWASERRGPECPREIRTDRVLLFEDMGLRVFKNLLMDLLLMCCFQGDFQEGKGPIKAFEGTDH